ncbi:hypothetical protein BKA57DRAFT_120460 [Linnemannia elongata]|nr:hypothetical protein BKA57DRAFT_120460 [Linnemannia elongata]
MASINASHCPFIIFFLALTLTILSLNSISSTSSLLSTQHNHCSIPTYLGPFPSLSKSSSLSSHYPSLMRVRVPYPLPIATPFNLRHHFSV